MASSPLAYALDRLGDRWTLLVIEVLLEGPRKFGEIEAAVAAAAAPIAPTVLTKRLRQLEADGIVVAKPYSERPVRVTYQLTSPGSSLATAVHVLRDWGSAVTGDDQALLHDTCGGPLSLRLWCPSCEVPVDPAEASDSIHL